MNNQFIIYIKLLQIVHWNNYKNYINNFVFISVHNYLLFTLSFYKPINTIECSVMYEGVQGSPELDTHDCRETPVSQTATRLIGVVFPRVHILTH